MAELRKGLLEGISLLIYLLNANLIYWRIVIFLVLYTVHNHHTLVEACLLNQTNNNNIKKKEQTKGQSLNSFGPLPTRTRHEVVDSKVSGDVVLTGSIQLR